MEQTSNNTTFIQPINETVKTGEFPLGPEKSIEDVGDIPGHDHERKVTANETRYQEVEVHERQIDDPVRNFMMSLGVQENVNRETVRPGAVFVGGYESSSSHSFGVDGDTVVQEPIVGGGTGSREDTGNENTQPLFLDHEIQAHLAPSDADVEARIVERLEAEILRDVEERMIQGLAVATVELAKQDDIVIADQVTESQREERPNKRLLWMMVSLALFLIVGGTVGGVGYAVGRDRQGQSLPDNTPASSMAPSAAPFIQVPLDSLLDELSADIAPTDADLLIVDNVTSPQGKALAWLQDDLITRTPGRSKSTVLERYALAVLYYSTSGESSWTFPCMNSDDVCKWNIADSGDKGVYCGEDQESVIDLMFSDLRMDGTLPWEVVLLSNLEVLNIDRNKLSGPIPSRISELTRLIDFEAERNKFTGTLPETFSPSIEGIDLEASRLTGTIPIRWGTTMPSLWVVNLAGNSFTGTIPTTFGNLTNVTSLNLADNLLTGTVPSELGQMSSLGVLNMGSNSLTESTNGGICDFLAGLQLDDLVVDCSELECPCCPSC